MKNLKCVRKGLEADEKSARIHPQAVHGMAPHLLSVEF